MVQGVPSVLTAVGEAFQLVEDRVSGVLIERGDPLRLADELQNLLENEEAARAMGEKGRERVLALYPAHKFTQAVAEVHAVALGTAMAKAP
jgi:glycosyltransferase involved in cell wall biosynthesis